MKSDDQPSTVAGSGIHVNRKRKSGPSATDRFLRLTPEEADAEPSDELVGEEVAVGGNLEAVLYDLGEPDIIADEPIELSDRLEGPAVGASALAGQTIELRPERSDTNTRLDKYLAQQLPELSRSYLQQLIEQGNVRVDGQVRRAAFKVTPGERIAVEVPPPTAIELEPEAIPLDIVYEDKELIVVNKPAGMVVHPAPGHASGTLVNALLHHAPEMRVGGTVRPGIVHRLDKDTSGLIVVAKTDRARNALVPQWEERSVEKRYIALVSGIIEDDEATIDAPIGRDPLQRQRMAVIPAGRRAVSHVKVLERFPNANATLVQVDIETGRTHQVRVHLAFVGHSIIGDEVYGRVRSNGRRTDPRVKRQFLHAARIAFNHPNGERLTFEVPLPPDLQAALERIRRENADDGRGGGTKRRKER
jgi:23S rRNA pseudouridine1911/1915/1917 synthase